MPISTLGLVLGAAMAQGVKDPAKKAQIEVLGGVLGTTPLGLVLVVTLARQASGPPPSGVDEAAIPDLREAGDDLQAATALLTANGLVAGPTARVLSEEAIGTIISSSPEQGRVVPLRTVVTVNVSAGLIVPTVTTLAVEKAVEQVEAAGFSADLSETDLPGDPDVVVKQDPAGESHASKGDTVNLYTPRRAPVAADARRIGPIGEIDD